MFDIILPAIPVFVVLLVVEYLSFRLRPDDHELGYDIRDSRTSLTMGIGNVVINIGWKMVSLVVLAAAFMISPFSLSPTNPLTWVILFFADDFLYYWFHRTHHTIRILWASHVVHHSSRYFNFSTALRQTWTPFTYLPYWIPLALLGMPPWMIMLQQSISLIYQFFIHTERVGKLWRPIEFVLNTPSHHRVHHGSNAQYLDRNYGGIMIIWDRLFGTFEAEGERVVYGLTKNIDTYNPVKVATHEYAAIYHDMRGASNWRDRYGYLVRGPGWVPQSTAEAAAAESASK
ncbi:sterol desaturase family protein [Tsukamurella spumae]|uniref:Sterol desaturase family protein n=1 Tax=Tsukamurella spumae TaxID=44753 RepID=A0A846X137_9ACTN|nr:sterol desaturase family protein [Tsukamurella spumae]NKY17962.1 sterol desaturase family protein [Tsukamurella spumae]